MQDASDLELIAHIYDVVLDAEVWSDVLERLATRVGAKAANLLVSDSQHPEVHVSAASSALTPELLATYHRDYAHAEKDDILRILSYPPREWVRAEELIDGPYAEYPTTQWLSKEYGIFDRVVSRLNAEPCWFDLVTLNLDSSRGPLTQSEEAVGRLFLPHLAKAIELSRPFHVLRARFHAALSVLDRFQVGVMVVDSAGHVILQNEEARRILDLDDGLWKDGTSRPRASVSANDTRLRDAIELALSFASIESARRESVVLVERRSGQESFVIDIGPLTGAERELDRSFSGAVLFIIDPTRGALASTRGMEELYGLTPAEADVLRLLVDGFTTGGIAEARNTTVETSRGQLKSVLAKTRTRARTDLVRLALRVNPPVDPLDPPGNGGK